MQALCAAAQPGEEAFIASAGFCCAGAVGVGAAGAFWQAPPRRRRKRATVRIRRGASGVYRKAAPGRAGVQPLEAVCRPGGVLGNTAVDGAILIGMGGLGCPASLALAQAGVRRLTLVDADRVELSNLPRQPWYRTDDVGQPKVEVSARRLREAFPRLSVAAVAEHARPETVDALVRGHDVVIDGTDSVRAKYFLSDAVARTGVPLVFGGVVQLEARVFRIRQDGPCLRCLFGEVPGEEDVPTCARAGVLGALAGVAGALQARVALAPSELPGEALLHVLDARGELRVRVLRVLRLPGCPGCGRREEAA
jgi:molybdopterin-synthase adenylyltransferase